MKMKILLITFLMFYLNSYSFGELSPCGSLEGQYVKFYLTDTTGSIDSVMVSFHADATYGLDTSLGEVNYFNVPKSVLDLRILRRNDTSGTFPDDERYYWLSCLDSYIRIMTDPENLDLKVDYSCAEKGSLYSNPEEIHFVLEVHSENYPVTLSYRSDAAFSFRCVQFQSPLTCLYETVINDFFPQYDLDTLYVFNNQEEVNLIAFNGWRETDDVEERNSPIKDKFISPNPATDYIEINLDNVETGLRPVSEEIEIFDVFGNHPSQTLPASEEGTVRLDVSNLQPGIYFVRVGAEFFKFVKI